MAMLITKFHRLIQNKLLWLAFLIIVVFSFVIWGTQMPDAAERQSNDAGKLNGESIPYEAYQQARFNTYLSIVLMSGRAVPVTPELEEQLHTMAWQRLASLKEAAKLGISSSDDEVVKSIHSFEFLQQGGRYNPQAYDQFAQQFLAQMRATKRDFEEHVRQEIIMQKLRVITERSLLVTPHEIERTFLTLTDTFEIEYVKLTPELISDDVKVSDEEVLAFFNKDPEQFTLAEKVKVKAAVFPIQDYVDQVEITDAEIQEFYDFNLDEYAIESDEPDTNLFSTAVTSYRPLEEVKDEIKQSLALKQAAILAEAKAGEFVQELSLNHKEGRGVFDKIAASMGTELIMAEPFTSRQIPEELEAGPQVVRAAFNLSDDDDYYYSDPVSGSNYVYVLALVERQPQRLPEFEEVKDDVEKMARELASYNALTEKAQALQEKAKEYISEGKSFDDAVTSFDLTSEKPKPFTMNTIDMDEDIASVLIRHILVRNSGELTEPIPTEDGSILLGYVKSRTPATDMTSDTMRPQIISTLRRQSSQVVFQEMQNYLLEKGDFEDKLRRTVEQTDEAETDEDPEV